VCYFHALRYTPQNGGGTEIRTPGELAAPAVFKIDLDMGYVILRGAAAILAKEGAPEM
jgi:hypothetical protein